MAETMVLDKPEQIVMYRLSSLRTMLKLEVMGIGRKGQSAYSILKAMGYKGNKAQVLELVQKDIDTFMQTRIVPKIAWVGSPWAKDH